MRIDTYLFEKGYSSSRTKAKALIDEGCVIVDGIVITKASYEVDDTVEIIIKPSCETVFVGRGGLKLQAALEAFHINPMGRTCADIGASTGGFTDCLLKSGAEKVYAIDSGCNQLVDSIKNDPRVISIEKMNARYMTKEDLDDTSFSLIVVDVSFISQRLIYPAIKDISENGADIVTLIKPQFEVGRENIGKNGIVKSDKAIKRVIEELTEIGESYGFKRMGLIESPIKGGSGNTEFLIHYKYNSEETL